jgi:hypothetical protein
MEHEATLLLNQLAQVGEPSNWGQHVVQIGFAGASNVKPTGHIY